MLAMTGIAAVAAFKGAQRVWKTGLGDILRPAIQREVGAAVRKTVRDMRSEVTESMAQQLREALHEELAPLREEFDELAQRVARTEGAIDAMKGGKAQPQEPVK
jgi:hypothetical protein